MNYLRNIGRAVAFLAALTMSSALCAQSRQQSGDNPSAMIYPTPDSRNEIIVPEVNGYKVVKADLHVHTIYSDGSINPSQRIKEAWVDGLDAIAITDHIEYRPFEKKAVKFLDGNVTVKGAGNDNNASDLNVPASEAEAAAKHRGMTLIHGAEITRNPKTIGHFNALFTKDNNLIYDPDPLQSIRNARKQGALIEFNHPGWRRSDNEYTSVMKAAMDEGLVDGVEIFNTADFYPDVIRRAVDEGLFVAGGSDIHGQSALDFSRYGVFRDMTLIFAKDSSAEAIREALEHGRTLAYGYGDIAGREDLLKDFFNAAVSVKVSCSGPKKYYTITNNSSFPFLVSVSGSARFKLGGMSSVLDSTTDGKLVITVANMWYDVDKHPEITITLQ